MAFFVPLPERISDFRNPRNVHRFLHDLCSALLMLHPHEGDNGHEPIQDVRKYSPN